MIECIAGLTLLFVGWFTSNELMLIASGLFAIAVSLGKESKKGE